MSPAQISLILFLVFAVVAVGGAFLSAHCDHEISKNQKRRSSDQ